MFIYDHELFTRANQLDGLKRYCKEERLDYQYIAANLEDKTDKKSNARQERLPQQRFFYKLAGRFGFLRLIH